MFRIGFASVKKVRLSWVCIHDRLCSPPCRDSKLKPKFNTEQEAEDKRDGHFWKDDVPVNIKSKGISEHHFLLNTKTHDCMSQI